MAKELSKKQKEEIGEILGAWSKIMYRSGTAPTSKEGHLDIKALHEMKETKLLIKTLKQFGVKDNKHLMDMGFMAAGMVLRFK